MYIRPCLEYGFPLFDAWVKSGGGLQFLKPLQLAHNRCMNWIGGGRANRPRLTGNLCGILDVRRRLQHLRTRFQYHLQMMDPANPLQILLDSLPLRANKRDLTSHLRWDDNYSTFLSETVFSPPAFSLTNLHQKLTDFLVLQKKAWIVEKNEKTPPLMAIVDEVARVALSDFDGILGKLIYFVLHVDFHHIPYLFYYRCSPPLFYPTPIFHHMSIVFPPHTVFPPHPFFAHYTVFAHNTVFLLFFHHLPFFPHIPFFHHIPFVHHYPFFHHMSLFHHISPLFSPHTIFPTHLTFIFTTCQFYSHHLFSSHLRKYYFPLVNCLPSLDYSLPRVIFLALTILILFIIY